MKVSIILLMILSYLCNGQISKIYFENFTVENGLSDNYINFVKQDSKGWIWISTGVCIERFDGLKFRPYAIYENDSVLLEDYLVRKLFETRSNILYACIEEKGLAVYNRERDRYERLRFEGEVVLNDVSVKNLEEDRYGNLWGATKKGICKIEFDHQTVRFYSHREGDGNSIVDNYVREVKLDAQQRLWIGTRTGLDLYDPEISSFYHFADTNPVFKDDILDIIKVGQHELWIGTGNHGIVIVNTETFAFRNLIIDKSNPRSKKVNCILQENGNEFWIGTRGGLYLYNKKNNSKICIQSDIHEENSLIHNSIVNISKDAKGDLWIGTRRGLSYLVNEKQSFIKIKAFPDNNHYLNNGEIYCIWINGENEAWIGTEIGGVNILNLKTGLFSYLTESDGLSNNCIKAINSIDLNTILIGTFQGGLNVYQRNTGTIKVIRHRNGVGEGLSSDIIWDIAIDKNKWVWLGTATGLDRYFPQAGKIEHIADFTNLTNGVTWISVDQDNDLWLGSEIIHVYRPGKGIINTFYEKGRDLFVDSQGNNWIMTNDKGIAKYDKQKGVIKYYGEREGIACNLTLKMIEDKQGKLWVSTARGLSCFNPSDETFKNYYAIDGIQGDQFNYGAAAKAQSGELFFGGDKGLTVFDPQKIKTNKYIPPVYITDFKIFNRSVPIGKDKTSILHKAISETDTLKIPFKYNVLTFEFAALNYTNSERNQYKYKLEGFDNEWIETTDIRSATYTNLNPGEYQFKVIASNDNGYWNKTGTSKTIFILPPYYRTIWFRLLTTILILGTFTLVFLFIFKRREMKKNFEFEKMKSNKLHELDSFKLQLFTNISHEIKTPLTLIITPLTKILKKPIRDPEIKEGLELIRKNANQLMKLITQLLDFRKLQSGKHTIDLKRGDIVRFSKNLFASFEDLMKEKDLSYHFQSVQSRIFTSFDPEKLRNILNNLLSNAIKYNKDGGTISFTISLVIEDYNNDNSRYIKMEVRDTGIGIQEKELSNIFKRFYSKSPNLSFNSSGIGLALVKELVELHHGMITVDSKEGEGSTFTVLLPYIEDNIEFKEDDDVKQEKDKELHESLEANKEKTNKAILLVVEDNEDVLKLMKNHFNKDFMVLDAMNGKEGVKIAVKTLPDIIVTDIMMPDMDGREMCKILKNDERTSHIPVIFLTALSSGENLSEGLKLGADDYITKPFDIDLLQLKIENLLSMRRSLREKYSKLLTIEPSQITVKTLDEQFLEKAIKITEKNINNLELNINHYIDQLGVSRMQMYRKLGALTNMTVKEFIKDIRLKRARQMLSEKKITISEVAYSVGFNDLSYFGRCFKRKFGMSPSEYNQKHVTYISKSSS